MQTLCKVLPVLISTGGWRPYPPNQWAQVVTTGAPQRLSRVAHVQGEMSGYPCGSSMGCPESGLERQGACGFHVYSSSTPSPFTGEPPESEL
jgi:hypothetical protein